MEVALSVCRVTGVAPCPTVALRGTTELNVALPLVTEDPKTVALGLPPHLRPFWGKGAPEATGRSNMAAGWATDPDPGCRVFPQTRA
jgi:hypothetical protein